MITNREFRDTINQLLKVIPPQILADQLSVSRSNILRWADGVDLPHHILRHRIIEFAEKKNAQ